VVAHSFVRPHRRHSSAPTAISPAGERRRRQGRPTNRGRGLLPRFQAVPCTASSTAAHFRVSGAIGFERVQDANPLGRGRHVCCEVCRVPSFQRGAPISRLSCFRAPRVACLISLRFSSDRPRRTSRLLSCPPGRSLFCPSLTANSCQSSITADLYRTRRVDHFGVAMATPGLRLVKFTAHDVLITCSMPQQNLLREVRRTNHRFAIRVQRICRRGGEHRLTRGSDPRGSPARSGRGSSARRATRVRQSLRFLTLRAI
jgi:hypothetical protein